VSNETGHADKDRQLGVIEAFTVVINQCPNGAVRSCAERALESVKQGGADALREQAYFVLTAIRGWRGDRATQVHNSLSAFLSNAAQSASDPSSKDPAKSSSGSD
jgi:hypothetical protein